MSPSPYRCCSPGTSLQPASPNPVIETAVHFGARRAILEVSALAVITWCQRWCLLSLLPTPSTDSRSRALRIDVPGATAAAAASQPGPWGVCQVPVASFKVIFTVLWLFLWAFFFFSLGHLVLIIFQEMRANKRKPFCYEYTCILKCSY